MKQVFDGCSNIEYEGKRYYVKNPQRNWSGYYMYRCDAWLVSSFGVTDVEDQAILDKLARLLIWN